jgi:arylsulfatase A-like enzyme
MICESGDIMRTMFIMMDSLNRHYLKAYGANWIKTPNLDRLARRGVIFDNHYCGSMPCMPARRELMTGRLNFLEAPWGPIEPWDDCLPVELRKKKGVYSHMVTDHYHYFHSGGEGYHTLFDSWEFERGQESDVWHPAVKEPEVPEYKGRNTRPYWVNRKFLEPENEADYPTPRCFMRAIDFIENNHEEDNWHLHLEVFDPHEPFVCPKKYLDMYEDKWDSDYHFDWPNYAPVAEEPAAVEHIRKSYAAVVTMTDEWLGKLLDRMDELDMWKDTVVILTTDHGHLLGEHGYWAKNYMFDYQELAHIPLIICTPETVNSGQRIQALTAAIDIMPTLMELHGAELTPHVQGKSLLHLLNGDEKHHDAVLYGYFGKDVNMFDGRYSYCRQPLEGSTLYHHTAMPRGFSDFIPRTSLAAAETGVFLNTSYNIPHYRIKAQSYKHMNAPNFNPIFDIINDPEQKSPVRDKSLEEALANKMIKAMERYGAPEDQYIRLGLK